MFRFYTGFGWGFQQLIAGSGISNFDQLNFSLLFLAVEPASHRTGEYPY
jgi:hypothetical protein